MSNHIGKKNLLYFAGLIFLLVIIGFTYGYLTRTPVEALPNESTGKDSSSPDTSIIYPVSKTTSDSVLVFERFYTKCRSSLADEIEMNSEHIGMSRTEIASAYPGWYLSGFSVERVVFYAEIDGYCPRHFVITEEDGYLVISNGQKETGELEPVYQTSIKFEWLSPEMKEQVKEGMIVDTEQEVEQFLENINS